MNKTLFIVGPTASGKTKLAIDLAKKFGGEVINADSRSIYKSLPILTAAPDLKERSGIRHHLFEEIPLSKTLTLSRFQKLARQKISQIQKSGRLPIVVGGSPLYINALLYDYQIPAVLPDKKLRRELEHVDLAVLVKKLKKLDPHGSKQVDLKNKRRVIRAFEIIASFGRIPEYKKSSFDKNKLVIGIKIDKNILKTKITRRIEKVYRSGAIHEVKKHKEELEKNIPVATSCGAIPILLFIDKKISLSESKKLFLKNDLKLVKKQLTWFKKDKNIRWLKNKNRTEAAVKKFLQK